MSCTCIDLKSFVLSQTRSMWVWLVPQSLTCLAHEYGNSIDGEIIQGNSLQEDKIQIVTVFQDRTPNQDDDPHFSLENQNLEE